MTSEFFVGGILAFCILFLICSSMYFKFGWFKRFFHDAMGWHTPDKNKEMTCDVVNVYAICKHCGKEIMQDSQGNWFTTGGD